MHKRLTGILTILLVVTSLLTGLHPPAQAHGALPLPTPPPPGELPPQVTASRVRAAAQAVLDKYAAHYGPQYDVVEVRVEGEWAYVAARQEKDTLHLLAHRGVDGLWQALLPSSEGGYLRWVTMTPPTLISSALRAEMYAQAMSSGSSSGSRHLVTRQKDDQAVIYLVDDSTGAEQEIAREPLTDLWLPMFQVWLGADWDGSGRSF